jgi:hypothetical protein
LIGKSRAKKPVRHTHKSKSRKFVSRPKLEMRPNKDTSKMSEGNVYKHTTTPSPLELMRQLEEAQTELKHLRSLTSEPDFCPTTPPFAPSSPLGSPPRLTRQTGADHIPEVGTSDHIARELFSEVSGGGAAAS